MLPSTCWKLLFLKQYSWVKKRFCNVQAVYSSKDRLRTCNWRQVPDKTTRMVDIRLVTAYVRALTLDIYKSQLNRWCLMSMSLTPSLSVLGRGRACASRGSSSTAERLKPNWDKSLQRNNDGHTVTGVNTQHACKTFVSRLPTGYESLDENDGNISKIVFMACSVPCAIIILTLLNKTPIFWSALKICVGKWETRSFV